MYTPFEDFVSLHFSLKVEMFLNITLLLRTTSFNKPKNMILIYLITPLCHWVTHGNCLLLKKSDIYFYQSTYVHCTKQFYNVYNLLYVPCLFAQQTSRIKLYDTQFSMLWSFQHFLFKFGLIIMSKPCSTCSTVPSVFDFITKNIFSLPDNFIVTCWCCTTTCRDTKISWII